MKGRQRRLILDTLLLGAVGTFSAQLFLFMLRISQAVFLTWMASYWPPGLPEEGGVLQQTVGSFGLLLVPLATTLGGLISGVLVYTLAPEAEGHGTGTAVEAFHRAGGFIRARVPLVKMLASAITIGSGGAAGREGPIALIAAGFGSVYATFTRRTEAERRLLVLIGMAAGLSAIFRSPVGTAFFAIEVLYRDMEFDSDALFYTMIASVVAYVLNGPFVGWQPLFKVPENLSVPHLNDYAWYAVLGVASGLVATLLPVVFYGARDLFKALPLPSHVKPAIGGLGVGLLALALPQVLGSGYGWVQEAIDGQLTIALLGALLFAKMIAFALTISSGGSGGVFAPSLYVGAMLGGLLAALSNHMPAPFVIVGMAAVFAGAARVPIATLLMVTEMTYGYQLLVPAALAVMLSYFVQSVLSEPLKYKSLYETQVGGRADSPAHDVEHVQTALRLLHQGRMLSSKTFGRLDLMSILKSGVPIDLADGKQLRLGVLRSESLCVGKPIGSNYLLGPNGDAEILAIIRDGHLLLRKPATVLQAEDQVIFAASSGAWPELARHMALLPALADAAEDAIGWADKSCRSPVKQFSETFRENHKAG
jgi:chloride channel protein, CIC family